MFKGECAGHQEVSPETLGTWGKHKGQVFPGRGAQSLSLGYRESRVSEGNQGRETEELISRCCCLLVQRDGSVLGRSADPSEWFCDRERSPICESSTLKQTAGRESEGLSRICCK